MNKANRDGLFQRLERKTHWSAWEDLHQLRDYVDTLEAAADDALGMLEENFKESACSRHLREALDKGK